MNKNAKKNVLRTLVLAFSLTASGIALGWHGGGWNGGGWHGGGWHGGGWGGGGWSGVGYGYAPACQSVRVCNYYGRCWIQRSCY